MQNKVRIVYVVSNINKALAFEWISAYLDRSRFELVFILLGQSGTELEQYLRGQNRPVHVVLYQKKSDVVSVFFQVFKLLRKWRPDVVHTHLFEANLLGLTAAWLLRVNKRIFTRHHAMVHYNEHPQGRKWDVWCNFVATDIIAISRTVENILTTKDKSRAQKIHLIHHGFDLRYFDQVTKERVEGVRSKYNLTSGSFPVVGVISRYVAWKGIQFIVPAFKNLLVEWPNAHLILANAHGDYSEEIKRALRSLPAGSFTEIAFEADLAALYKVIDIFVHTPIDEASEAFGQTYVEPLAAGVPAVFSLSGVAHEFIHNGENALVVRHKNSDDIYHAIQLILKDDPLKQRLIANGKQSVAARFNLEKMLQRLAKVYTDDN